MYYKTIISALALTVSTASFAAEPTPATPNKECCCCKKDEDSKIACCDKHKKGTDEQDGHDMDAMGHN